MKKSKLSLGLVTGFVASLALSGCGSVKARDNSLLTYTGYNGTKYDVVTEKMYDEYRKDSNVMSTFYDKVLEVMIRDLFESGASVKFATKDLTTIKELAKANVKAAKAKATESAKTNGTSYDKEWESILSGEGVEDEKELLQKYIYDEEKTVLEDALYASLNEDDDLKTKWIDTTHPYHIRHILAKVDGGASNYTRGTISADQAKNISDAGLALGLGNDTFGGVAKLYSEDGSAATYGDVGLVTNKVSSSGSFSMVTEFQLAIYIYDAIYKVRNSTLVDELVTGDAKAAFNKITRVPYDVFRQLASKDKGGFGDVTDLDGIQVGEGEEAVYPRNILWNKYLNHHEPFVITNDTVGDFDLNGNELNDVAAIKNMTPETYSATVDPNGVGAVDPSIVETTGNYTGFRKASDVGLNALGDTLVLTDEKSNPIFGVRSEYGIHFIIIEKSAFESTDTLAQYYQAYSPKQAEWDVPAGVKTYVNYAGFTDAQMTERANAVKDAIKGFDGTYQYRVFDYLMDSTAYGGTYKAADRFNIQVPAHDASTDTAEEAASRRAAELLQEIIDYVDRLEEKNAYDQETGFKLAWKNFLDKFAEQTEERSKYERIVPYGCAIGFKGTGHEGLYEIGGACYYGNKKQ